MRCGAFRALESVRSLTHKAHQWSLEFSIIAPKIKTHFFLDIRKGRSAAR